REYERRWQWTLPPTTRHELAPIGRSAANNIPLRKRIVAQRLHYHLLPILQPHQEQARSRCTGSRWPVRWATSFCAANLPTAHSHALIMGEGEMSLPCQGRCTLIRLAYPARSTGTPSPQSPM